MVSREKNLTYLSRILGLELGWVSGLFTVTNAKSYKLSVFKRATESLQPGCFQQLTSATLVTVLTAARQSVDSTAGKTPLQDSELLQNLDWRTICNLQL